MEDKLLIQGIKKKDESALIKFVDDYGPTLKGAIYPILAGRQELMEEVLNDTLLAIWENISSYKYEVSSFKNWCATLAKYKAIDALRKEIRHSSQGEYHIEMIGQDDSYPLIDKETAEEILSLLSPEDQEIFLKLFLKGYSYDDLEKLTGLSKDILYNRVSRGKRILRKKRRGERYEENK